MAYAADPAAEAVRARRIDPALVAARLATVPTVIRYAPAIERVVRPLPQDFRRPLNPCPEIDCVRHRLPPATIVAAETRALALGVGADEVLIASGAIAESDYYEALAHSLGHPFVDLETLPRAICPLSDEELIGSASTGIVPLTVRQRFAAFAPRGVALRGLLRRPRMATDLPERVMLTTPGHVARFVRRHAAAALSARATDALRLTQPPMSAAAPPWRARAVAAVASAVFACATLIEPAAVLGAVSVGLSVVFLAWSVLRLAALWQRPTASGEPVADCDLPVYSVLAALHREAAMLPNLIAALRALDYPAEKLDIKIILEADDLETRAAAAALAPGPPFDVVLVPPSEPRTKPKALNFALPLTRGKYVVIYDAEDQPEPDQLRRALAAFNAGPRNLACVQARLTIDNTSDSCIARQFTAEYAGLFDALLPGLAALGLPIPLGGSSNHFRGIR